MRHLNLTALEDIAVDLATEAATLITAPRPQDLQLSAKSTATDPVTAMDRRAEALVRRRLATLRPGEGVYGEEEGVSPGSIGPSSIIWVVDPIDGTVNYLYDIPHYAVSVAAVEGDPRVPGQWRPLAGAVADPGRGLVYHARVDGGAWSRRFDPSGAGGGEGGDGPGLEPRAQAVKLAVNVTDGLASSLIATGFSYRSEVRREQALALVELLPRVRDIRRTGSAALDLCAVAAGLVDGYYEQLLNPWDIAAGWLLVTEAGGRVSGWGDSQAGGDRLVAGSEAVRRDLVYLLDGMSGEE